MQIAKGKIMGLFVRNAILVIVVAFALCIIKEGQAFFLLFSKVNWLVTCLIVAAGSLIATLFQSIAMQTKKTV